ncbi:MAG: chemotaxis protein CheD [Clostridia bacterium]|nr:chemotaxis protein CheD [Clostridia bacterium]
MGNKIVVGISDLKVAKDPDTIISYALGSCVGICLYDKVNKVAGLSHILLPYSDASKEISNPMKFADTAIEILVRQMVQAGGKQTFLTAKIAGGANMFGWEGETVGDKNVTSVCNELKRLRIPLLASDVGLNYGRTVSIDATDGSVTIKALTKDSKVI